MSKAQLTKLITDTKLQMETAARDFDFLAAARYRDEMAQLQERLAQL